jgi:hypothetical protein
VISTIGYRHEIVAPQSLHFARSNTQLNTGTLSYQRIVFLQLKHIDRGFTTLLCHGSREMHTFRKLPISNPTRNAAISNATGKNMTSV